MTGDKQLISGDSWRHSEAAKREKGGLGVQKIFFKKVREWKKLDEVKEIYKKPMKIFFGKGRFWTERKKERERENNS